jgi:tetrahydromethanopterin S-methyltransferase subunit B
MKGMINPALFGFVVGIAIILLELNAIMRI